MKMVFVKVGQELIKFLAKRLQC